MNNSRFILSEAPDALDGVLEWLNEDIEREEENSRLSYMVEEHIRLLVMEIANRRKLVDKD